jgi:NAD(P)-dependent dehydrogenase (short-subunit alcohol dehydrogenase family)
MGSRQVAVVTGASGNLGQAVCTRLLAAEFRILRVERDRAVLDGEEIAKIDLGSADATRTLFSEVQRKLGSIDAVVHTVGTFQMSGEARSWSDDNFRFLFDTNVLTTAHVISASLAVMQPQGRGRIVSVVSTAANQGSKGLAAYSASKAAQLRMIESAAAECAGTAVSVSAVLPGTMDTPANRTAMPDADRSHWVSLEDVSELIAFLLSPAASALNGQAIRIAREVTA